MSKKVISIGQAAWTKLEPAQLTEEMKSQKVLAVFQNNLCVVYIKEAGAIDGTNNSPPVTHLIIHSKYGKELSYENKRNVKNELCSNDAEAVELIPASWRELKEIQQTHLWVLPLGQSYPIGLLPHDYEERIQKAQQDVIKNSGVQINKEDLELFIVDQKEYKEVFMSEDEAIESYKRNNVDFPGGEIGTIGKVPFDNDNYIWSEGAKHKAAILNSLMTGNNAMSESSDISNVEDKNLAEVYEDKLQERQQKRHEMAKEASQISENAIKDTDREKQALEEIRKIREELIKSKG